MESTNCPGGTRYIWQSGDTVSSLARRLNAMEQEIRRMNDMLNLNDLAPGDAIRVPTSPLACAEGTLYALKMDDTLLSIARNENIPLMELLEHNPYLDPETMTAGLIICLPKAPEQNPPNAPEYLVGVVRYGETIADILMEHDISLDSFRRANPSLNPHMLLPGLKYLIPPSGVSGLCPRYSYVILENETIAAIAQKFGIGEADLLEANPDLAPGDFSAGRTICLMRE